MRAMVSRNHSKGGLRWLAPICLGLLVLYTAHARVPQGRVARALFTTGVVEREPVDRVLVAGPDINRIYFFTDLRGMEGQVVSHRWEYNGEVVSTVKFEVKGPRWRVYSARELSPAQTGKWTAMVVDADGWPLRAVVFEYVADVSEKPAVILPLN